MPPAASAHRLDIQILRAIAVLAVLGFHFQLPGMAHGYLGVDVFFVISGHLMTRVITAELDAGSFCMGAFLLRRARRLMPAALAMLALCTLLAPWVLAPTALHDYTWQLAGALGFVANMVLWQQSGYFNGAAELKPLLHTWSLSVEEQFYFLLPLVLMVVAPWGPRGRQGALLALTFASLACCMMLGHHAPDAAFYLLPSRAWELLLGALCALRWRQSDQGHRLGWLDTAWIALPAMAWLLSQGLDPVHPRGDAALIGLATVALIVRPSRLLGIRHPFTWPLHRVGDISYSLYLVHWPMLALARHVWLEGIPQDVSLSLIGASFVLAWCFWRWVERPTDASLAPLPLMRSLQPSALLLCLAAGVLAWRVQQPQGAQWARLMQPNHGLSLQCEFGSAFTPRAACRTSTTPRTLVWGDSYAMHLLPALQTSAPKGGLLQATRSLCGPVPGLAHIKPGDSDEGAQQCLAFSQSVLDQVDAMPSVKYVLLSARWQYYFDQTVLDAAGHHRVASDAELAQATASAIDTLHQLGKKVLIVAPPPQIGPQTDLGACTERHALGLITVSTTLHADCAFDQTSYLKRQARVHALLEDIARRSHTQVLWLDTLNCHDGVCQTMLDGTPLYRDAGHLSQLGAAKAGQYLNLKARIEQDAR